MAYDTITLGVASFMLVPGLLFMLKHKVLVAEIFLSNPAYTPLKRAAPTPSAFPLYASLAAYYLFLVGALAFCLASVILGLALDLPPAFAVCAGLTGMVTILLYMAVAGHSITGIPGVRGPPVPARIALIIIGIVLNANAYLHYRDHDTDRDTWNRFGGCYALAGARSYTHPACLVCTPLPLLPLPLDATPSVCVPRAPSHRAARRRAQDAHGRLEQLRRGHRLDALDEAGAIPGQSIWPSRQSTDVEGEGATS